MVEDQRESDQNQREFETPQLSNDQFYRALGSKQRRRLLYVLLDEGECTVGEITTILSGWEATETGTMETAEDRNRLAIELKHAHLPLLVEAGLITHDRRSDTVGIELLDPLIVDLLTRSIEVDRPAP